jgi:PAS domain S-box-containing protein
METVSRGLMCEVEKEVRDNPDALVCLIDTSGIFRYLSPSVTSFHGYLPAEGVGRPFTDFFPPDKTVYPGLGLQDAILTGQSVELTRTVRHKSGSYRRMRGIARSLVDQDTGQVYVLAIGRPCE